MGQPPMVGPAAACAWAAGLVKPSRLTRPRLIITASTMLVACVQNRALISVIISYRIGGWQTFSFAGGAAFGSGPGGEVDCPGEEMLNPGSDMVEEGDMEEARPDDLAPGLLRQVGNGAGNDFRPR